MVSAPTNTRKKSAVENSGQIRPFALYSLAIIMISLLAMVFASEVSLTSVMTSLLTGRSTRFMTCGKRYTYRILNSRHGSAIRRNTFAHVPIPLDVDAMRQALPTLLGTHDFAAYQASGGTAKTTIRTIRMAEMTVQGDEIILLVEGDAFLYNMVRIIAGTLIEIGLHRRSADAFTEAFRTLDRLSLGVTAPPHGLELTKVYYPEEAFRMPEAVRWHEE